MVAWRLAPGPWPPLYDALPAPAESYRYLQPPPGITTPPPSAVDKDVAVTGGQTPTLVEATDEQPAQAQLLAEMGAFVLPPGTTVVHVHIAAVPPPSTLPADGRLDGNVYLFQVTARGTPLALRPGALVTVILRGPPGQGQATLELFDGSTWQRVPTSPVGFADTYQGNVPRLGEVALVVRGTAPTSGGELLPAALGAILATASLLAALGVLLLLRGDGARAQRPGRPSAPRRRR